MESYEVIDKAVSAAGVKYIADGMGMSASMLYKWCQPKQDDASGGTSNPLDRVALLYELTGDKALVAWLCQKANGIYVDNPSVDKRSAQPIRVTGKMLKEFSDLIEAVSASLGNDGRIDVKEATGIREEWENLKMITESFVYSCEKGAYKTDCDK